jgi:uncharacterized membrane protein
MRINQSVLVNASPQTVWDYLADPENYLRFMSGITRWEVVGDRANGCGARYRMLVQVGAAEVGGLIELVEWDEPYDIAWHSVTGVDQRGRWRIRAEDGKRTRIEFRFMYGVVGGGPAGLITEFAAMPTLRSHMRRTLQQLKRQVEHERRRAETERRRSGRQATTA